MTNANDEQSDRIERIVADANGDSVTIESVTARPERGETLLNVLRDDEQPHHLLLGRIVDFEASGESDERGETRRRKMAAPGCDIVTLLTDRRAVIIVERDGDDDVLTVPYDACSRNELETAAERNWRLIVEASEYTYYVDASKSSTLECERAEAFLSRQVGAEARPTNRESATDPLTTLERLAELRDRGVITDDEFEAKKAELLDRI